MPQTLSIFQDMFTLLHNLRRLPRFARDESGAVTVDWVVITAVVVGLGATAAALVRGNVPALADKISTYISVISVGN